MLPVGSIIAYAGEWDAALQEQGWLPCDGREVPDGEEFALLARILGKAFQQGVEVSTAAVLLPDLRGRSIFGTDGADLARGVSGGEREHALAFDAVPPHRHAWIQNNAGNSGGLVVTNSEVSTTWDDQGNATNPGRGVSYTNTNVSLENLSGSEAAVKNAVPHNNMPPYLALTYIIKYR